MDRSVLIADDEPVVRSAYRAFLVRSTGFRLAAEASTGAEAVEKYERLRPDLVLMDLNMPVMDGVAAIRTITQRWPRACVVALTTFGTNAHVVAALRAGASGYLTKDASRAELQSAMEQALRGDMPLSRAVRRELVATLLASSGDGAVPEAAPEASGVTSTLTDRERELLQWLAHGLTNSQIASRMFVSEGTVKQYLTRVGDKLGASSRTQTVIRAIQVGVIDPHGLPSLDE